MTIKHEVLCFRYCGIICSLKRSSNIPNWLSRIPTQSSLVNSELLFFITIQYTIICQHILWGDVCKRFVVVPCCIHMYLLLLPFLSYCHPVVNTSLPLTYLPRCVYAILIVQKPPYPSSHTSSVTIPHLFLHFLHLTVSPLPLSLMYHIFYAILFLHRLNCFPCMSYPLYCIPTTSVFILLYISLSPHNIVLHHNVSFADVCICVAASIPCLHRLHLYHS